MIYTASIHMDYQTLIVKKRRKNFAKFVVNFMLDWHFKDCSQTSDTGLSL